MKLLAIIGALVAGTACLRASEEHLLNREEDPAHQLFWSCQRNGGEKCGLLWRSCCQKGYCTQSQVGVYYCPDDHQLDD